MVWFCVASPNQSHKNPFCIFLVCLKSPASSRTNQTPKLHQMTNEHYQTTDICLTANNNAHWQLQLFRNLIMTVNHLHRAIQSAVGMLPVTAVVLQYVHHLCHLREDQHLHYFTQIHNWLDICEQNTINTVKHQQVGWRLTAISTELYFIHTVPTD